MTALHYYLIGVSFWIVVFSVVKRKDSLRRTRESVQNETKEAYRMGYVMGYDDAEKGIIRHE